MRTLAVLLLFLSVLTPKLYAQYEEFGEQTEMAPKKKQPSLFHRPAKKDPASQLIYADELLDQGRKKEARKQFINLVHQWHESREAPIAQFEAAKLLEESGDLGRAFDEYQYLFDFYPGSFPFDEVISRQFGIANHIRTARHGKVLGLPGFEAPERALPLFRQIIENAPHWDRSFEARLYIGLIHERNKDYDKAMESYRKAEVTDPQNPLAGEAALRRVSCLYKIAQASPRDESALRDALSAMASFLRDYPDHAEADEMQELLDKTKAKVAKMCFRQAEFYETKARRPEAAILAYRDFIRNFPSSDLAETAAARINRLKAQTENEEDE